MDWVRLYHDMPTDPKWRVIAKKSGQRIGDVIAVFNFVLVNASANGADRGRLSNLSNEDVGAALDLDEQDVRAILAAMEGRVIAVDRLIAWEARNPKREDDAKSRTRDWRERKRTLGDAPVTQRDAPETETETETAVARAREETSNEMNRLNKLFGFDERNWTVHAANIRFLIDLKAEGCDFERHIFPAAEQMAKGNKTVRSLAYIRPKTLELRDAAQTIASLPIPFEQTDERGWKDRMAAWGAKGLWSPKWGLKPDDAGCKCPPKILAMWHNPPQQESLTA